MKRLCRIAACALMMLVMLCAMLAGNSLINGSAQTAAKKTGKHYRRTNGGLDSPRRRNA